MSLRRDLRGLLLGPGGMIWLILCVLSCGSAVPAAAQPQQFPTVEGGRGQTGDAEKGNPVGQPPPVPQSSGTISGTLIIRGGALAVGVEVQLTRDDHSPKQQAVSGENGEFSFANVPSGPFHITITPTGFEPQEYAGTLRPGEDCVIPQIALNVIPIVTAVTVVAATQVEIAEEQIKEQEQQRVFGFIPNFYATYAADPAPLVARQKFKLAWRSVTDPLTFAGVGVLAGAQHAADDIGGYGQGASGYAKRYGAAYVSVFAGTLIGSAVLPSILKQDPRYFYKGTGSIRSRILYALGNAVICKGDNKRWQPNYSGILGSFATASLSYLYYPPSDRNVSQIIVQNSLIKIGESAIAGIFQEFVFRRLTPHHHNVPVQSSGPQS